MKAQYIQKRLQQLFMLSPAVHLKDHPKMVFMSDFHLGNGGDLDDFKKNAYRFSSENKIISIIGHTHRPLFESLAKIDSHKFKIENLCRTYHLASASEKQSIEEEIRFHKQKLEFQYKKNRKNGSRSSLYNSHLLIPCLFNSGCAIGKRGITSLEIEKDTIRLVYWFDGSRNGTYFKHLEYSPEQLATSDYFRTILKSDSLDYIFSRIELLT